MLSIYMQSSQKQYTHQYAQSGNIAQLQGLIHLYYNIISMHLFAFYVETTANLQQSGCNNLCSYSDDSTSEAAMMRNIFLQHLKEARQLHCTFLKDRVIENQSVSLIINAKVIAQAYFISKCTVFHAKMYILIM